MNSFFGYSNSGKDLLGVLLFSIDPLPPRDGCLFLSVFCVTWHRRKAIGQNAGIGPISLWFEPALETSEFTALTRPASS